MSKQNLKKEKIIWHTNKKKKNLLLKGNDINRTRPNMSQTLETADRKPKIYMILMCSRG